MRQLLPAIKILILAQRGAIIVFISWNIQNLQMIWLSSCDPHLGFWKKQIGVMWPGTVLLWTRSWTFPRWAATGFWRRYLLHGVKSRDMPGFYAPITAVLMIGLQGCYDMAIGVDNYQFGRTCCLFVSWSSHKFFQKRRLTISSPVVYICTTRFNTKKFHVVPTQCICVFCVDLRANSD